MKKYYYYSSQLFQVNMISLFSLANYITQAEKKNNPWSVKTVLPGANQSEIEKFQRLMGNTKNQASSIEEKEAEEEARRQMELNARLMEQYEHARNATHINRGTGLGYSSTLYQAHN